MSIELVVQTFSNLPTIMGKQQSKEEVIIAQSGGEASKEQLSTIGWMITGIIILLMIFVVFFVWNHFKRRTQLWFQRQVHGRGLQVATPPVPVTVQMQPAAPSVI